MIHIELQKGIIWYAKDKQQPRSDLRNALSKLLLQQPFESITIRQLTETAGINRGTFYLHYVDKYDMFEQMKMDMSARIG